MIVYVDADACPVKDIIVDECKKRFIKVTMVMDYCHEYNDGYSNVLTVDKGSDSADFKITNSINKGDLCITQDIGLCSMILARGAYCMHINGFEINSFNIDELLFKRHINKELRRANKKGTKFNKRTSENDNNFRDAIIKFLDTFTTNV